MIRSAALALLTFLLVAAPGAHAGSPTETVERFQDTLIATMKAGESLDFQGRWRRLEPVVLEAFDFDFITQLVIGSYWSDLDSPHRRDLKRAVIRIGLATLASQFNGYAGERFEVRSEHALRDGRRRVRSEFHEGDGERVSVDYVLEERGGVWRILNVWFAGVSASRIHRHEFASIIEREGVDALIDRIERKVELYATTEG